LNEIYDLFIDLDADETQLISGALRVARMARDC